MVNALESGVRLVRPCLHFVPLKGWINDPNGLVQVDGVWHLYYQHNPRDVVWGDIHWGHATSTDLVHWTHHPAALRPHPSLGVVASGCAVVDHAGTSGLGQAGQGPVVALFSHFPPNDGPQCQSLAWSVDGGHTFTEHPANPIIPNAGLADFRDPKVIWHEATGRWVMVLAAGDHIEVHVSSDLVHWTHLQDWGADRGSHVGIWECPDLFPLELDGQTHWVLLVSVNAGAPNGGSGTQVFLGSLGVDGFRCESHCDPSVPAHWLEHGPDSYAGVTFSDVADGRRVLIAWMSNWDYAGDVPAADWRGSMTVPRRLRLVATDEGARVRMTPVRELDAFWRAADGAPSPCLRVRGVLPVGGGTRIEGPTGHVEVHRTSTHLQVDTRGLAAVPGAPRRLVQAPLLAENEGEVDIIIDTASIEVFADQGAAVLTVLTLPKQPLETVVPGDLVDARVLEYCSSGPGDEP